MSIDQLTEGKSKILKEKAEELGIPVVDLPMHNMCDNTEMNQAILGVPCTDVLNLTYLIDEGQYASDTNVNVILILTHSNSNEVETVSIVPNSLESLREQLCEWEDRFGGFQMLNNSTSLFDYELIHAEVCNKTE